MVPQRRYTKFLVTPYQIICKIYFRSWFGYVFHFIATWLFFFFSSSFLQFSTTFLAGNKLIYPYRTAWDTTTSTSLCVLILLLVCEYYRANKVWINTLFATVYYLLVGMTIKGPQRVAIWVNQYTASIPIAMQCHFWFVCHWYTSSLAILT